VTITHGVGVKSGRSWMIWKPNLGLLETTGKDLTEDFIEPDKGICNGLLLTVLPVLKRNEMTKVRLYKENKKG
jgi:hypothetical protein